MDIRTINGFVQIKPKEQGLIQSNDTNEYEVVYAGPHEELTLIAQKNIIIAEDRCVVKTNINGKEILFIHRDEIIAVIPMPHGHDDNHANS